MVRLFLNLTLAFALVGCGGGDSQPQPDPVEEQPVATPTVSIVQPMAGATVPVGPLTVVFEVEGVVISPAGTMDAGTGHHHLIVDADVESWTDPIGAEEGRYIHMGQAQTEFVLEGLEPGEHRLIAVVADGVHIPLSPPVADTITITVEGG